MASSKLSASIRRAGSPAPVIFHSAFIISQAPVHQVVDVPWDLDGWEKAIDADCTDRVKTQLMLDLFGEMVVCVSSSLPSSLIKPILYVP